MARTKLNWKMLFVSIFVFLLLSLLKADECVVTFLGHSGFKIELSGQIIFIDTFNSMSDFIDPQNLSQGDADYIFYTHAHGDHFEASEAAVALYNTGAKVVGNNEIINLLSEIPFPPVSDDQKIAINPAPEEVVEFTLDGQIEVIALSDGTENCYFFKTSNFGFSHEGDLGFVLVGRPYIPPQAPEEWRRQMKLVFYPQEKDLSYYPSAEYFFKMHQENTCECRGPDGERVLSPGNSVVISFSSSTQSSSWGRVKRAFR
jgi:L-ascorbate metabolism protein UlaG (beta-lactamase superfamily)